MSFSQANGLFELLGSADPSDGPLNLRLAGALRTRITEGQLRTGELLPPSRLLAESLGVSRWVVTEAYEQLKGEGYLVGRVGSGTRVSYGGAARAAAPTGPTEQPRPRDARSAETGSTGVRGGRHDLWPVAPDLSSFPRPQWRSAALWALGQATVSDLGYPDPEGNDTLRTTMSDYLRRVRGIDAESQEVHITSGTRSAVALICHALRASGVTRVAVEDPGWTRILEVAERNGLEVVGIPVDADGLQTDLLARADVGAVFVAPTHQFPMGVSLSPGRRLDLLRWAEEGDRLIVEDDFDAEFRYDRRPVGALAALGRDNVIYLGSTSKTLGPALRLGWAVVPEAWRAGLERARIATGVLVPALDQLTFARLISTGRYDRHLRRMRKVYLARRRAIVVALRQQLPGTLTTSMDAGLHVVWWLPDGVDEDRVLAECARSGLSLLGLSRCRMTPGRGGLVIGYGNVAERYVDDIAAALAAACRRAA